MRERVLMTIHSAIPADAIPDIVKLCEKLRVVGDGEVLIRQVGWDPRTDRQPAFELYVHVEDGAA